MARWLWPPFFGCSRPSFGACLITPRDCFPVCRRCASETAAPSTSWGPGTRSNSRYGSSSFLPFSSANLLKTYERVFCHRTWWIHCSGLLDDLILVTHPSGPTTVFHGVLWCSLGTDRTAFMVGYKVTAAGLRHRSLSPEVHEASHLVVEEP